MTGPIPVGSVPVLTDEIRAAVFAEACDTQGHVPQLRALIGGQGMDGNGVKVEGPDGKLPHLSCSRCGKVWIIMEQPGLNYDDAAAAYVRAVPAVEMTTKTVDP